MCLPSPQECIKGQVGNAWIGVSAPPVNCGVYKTQCFLLQVPVLPCAYLRPAAVHKLFMSICTEARADSCPEDV